MSSVWTKAVLGNRAAACESPIAANHPISPVAVQRMISQARLKISHAPRSAPSLTGKTNTRKCAFLCPCVRLCTIGGGASLLCLRFSHELGIDAATPPTTQRAKDLRGRGPTRELHARRRGAFVTQGAAADDDTQRSEASVRQTLQTESCMSIFNWFNWKKPARLGTHCARASQGSARA